MEEFLGRYRNLSVLLAVVLVQIIFLGYQVRTAQGSSLLQEWTIRGITPITKSVRGVTDWIGASWENYFWLIDTKQQNDQLRRQVERLKLENAGLRSTLARFGREERLITYQQELFSQTVMAQVIGRGANSNSREIFISAGLDSGVKSGMPVITPDGIVGKVQASYPAAALVMLITDPEAGAGVLLGRSRAGGILKGTGRGYCSVDYISHEVDVEIGETVFTSGDDRVFPKGLRIGEVIELDRGTDFQEIRIKPFAALDRLEEVLVITAGVHQDLPESPQAQPPQFLMPLPDVEDPLRAAGAPPEQAAEDSAADPWRPEEGGRVTDADRLRQYYQSIAAQQGHRIGHGGPGTPAPNFNPQLPAPGQATPRAPAPASPAPSTREQGVSPQQGASGGAAEPASANPPPASLTPQRSAPQRSAPPQTRQRQPAPEQSEPESNPAPTDRRSRPAGAGDAPEQSPAAAPSAATTPSGAVADPGPAPRTSASQPTEPGGEVAPTERGRNRPGRPAAANPQVRQ